VLLRFVLATLLVAGAIRPPDAFAHPGDIVLEKAAPGRPAVGAFATGTDLVTGQARLSTATVPAVPPGLAPPPPRRNIIHDFTVADFDPARSITSAAMRQWGRIDVATRA
jgi:hypothetical protein